jgi:uncharacterized protein YdhG (YjbR/CyaY superfamily)
VTAGTIDGYVAGLGPEAAEVVAELRRRVHAVRPDVTEVLRYDIPTFQVDDRSRVHVAAWAKHVSIYPVPGPTPDDSALADDLAPYLAGKGTLKLPLGKPMPWELVDRVLRALLA